MQSELNQFLEDLAEGNTPIHSLDDSAVFKARTKLAPKVFLELNDKTLEFFDQHGVVRRWHGFQLIDVDGTTLRLPQTEEIREFFSPQVDAKQNPVGPPLARLNLLYDPLNDLNLSVALDATKVSEIQQLRHQEWSWKADQLLIGDRHYDAFWLFAWLKKQGCQFCIRLKIDLRRPVVKAFLNSGLKEQVVRWSPGRAARKKCQKNNVPTEAIHLRLIRVELPEGEVEILATSLLDEQEIPASEFEALYHRRWPVEEKFKQLKFRANIENWSGKKPLTVYQDVYSRLWVTNLMVLMSQGMDEEIQERTKDRKYEYHINWAQAIASTKRWLGRLFFGSNIERTLERLTELFLTALSPIRPKRKYERNHKPFIRRFYICYKLCT